MKDESSSGRAGRDFVEKRKVIIKRKYFKGVRGGGRNKSGITITTAQKSDQLDITSLLKKEGVDFEQSEKKN